MEVQQKNDPHGSPIDSSFQNQQFLLNFIMGMYLGPDVTFDNPRRSAIQRLAEESQPYTSRDLGSSYVSMALLENLYYYLLRKADPSLILKADRLQKYIKGDVHLTNWRLTEDNQQFTSFFPLDLHEQIWYPTSFRIVKGIVLINDPVMSHLEDKDLEKFKSLSCIGDLKIDMDELIHYGSEYHQDGNANNSQHNCTNKGNETITRDCSNGGDCSLVRAEHKLKRRRGTDCLPMPRIDPLAKHDSKEGDFERSCVFDGAAIMSFRALGDVGKCNSESDACIVLSGTAKKGRAGPPVGAVDVGVNKVAYYFRVALPGVRKDYCKFSCEIESDGKVHVRGLTSGGKSIKKPSRFFEMKFRQLCPPGQFTLSFSLPGPVDPRLFAPNFRSDGIFEGVIIKHTRTPHA